MNDRKDLAADAGDVLKEVTDTTVQQLVAMRTEIEENWDDARARLHDARLGVTERAKAAADATDGFVRENPWKVVGVAAGVGLLIGFLLTRR